MNINETVLKFREVISIESADLFETRYPNLLVCFDTGKVYTAIASFFQIEGLPQTVKDDFSCPTLCEATEDAFLTLLKRGALDEFVRVRPLPEAAQAELDKMAGVASPVNDPVVDARVALAASVDECVADFRGKLDSRSFRSKWLSGDPSRRAVYEGAIAAGRL